MTPFLALVRKHGRESRWLLGLTSLALFFLSWLTVVITVLTEAKLRRATSPGRGMRGLAFRAVEGRLSDLGSVAFEVAWWNHPFILVNVLLWAISRGSAGVSAEIERGTLDLTLSRPISRTTYLTSQILSALLGLAVLSSSLILGTVVSGYFNKVDSPPTLVMLARPALNLFGLGLAVYGFTLMCSAVDQVRWRPNLIGSVATLTSFVILVIANVPVLEDWKWIGNYSIFKAYDPVSAAVTGKDLGFHVLILVGIGVTGIVLALLGFARRDLPANS